MIDKKNLGNISNVKLFKDGTVLIKEDDVNPDNMYIILNGNVNVVKGLDTDHPSVIDILGPGRIFGEQCLFTDIWPSESYITQTPISAVVISKEYFLEITSTKPHLVVTIMEELCRELHDARQNKSKRKSAKSAEVKKESSLLPEKHKGYPIPQPETFEEYLLTAEKTCPFCKTTFKTDLIYNSKLRIKAPAGIDMRKHYVDFEPAWYDVVICPKCYFSSFDEYFEKVDLIYKSPEIVKALEKIKENIHLDFEEERNLDFVFIVYYIALVCADAYDNNLQLISKLWLQLTYLYKDAEDEEMYKYAIEKTKEAFNNFYGAVKMKPENEQYCLLVMAHLAIELGDEKSAIMNLNNVRTIKTGHQVYKTMAENKYYDIREAKDFEKKQTQSKN